MGRGKKNGIDELGGEPISVTIADDIRPDPEESEFDGRPAFNKLKHHRTPFLHSANGRRRDEIAVSRYLGKYSRSRLPWSGLIDVALDATFTAAAARVVASQNKVLEIRPEDIRVKIRRHRSPLAIVFVVDNSWSVHVEATLERVKGVILGLLKDARTHRDKVALVAFRHSRRPEATVCLPLTASYRLAIEKLKKLVVSGSTPLPDALYKAYRLLRQEQIKYNNAVPVMVIATDGLPNVPLRPGKDTYLDVASMCRRLPRDGIAAIVVDTEPQGAGAGANGCRQMAALSRGKYLPVSMLTRRAIEEALGELV